MQADFDLERIVAPTARAVFFATHWERQPLLVSRHQPDYFASLLSLDEIDRVTTTLNLRYPDIYMVNADEEVAREDYTVEGGAIDVARLYENFAAGSTVILDQLHRRLSPLAELCRALEQELSVPFQTNVYLTPPNAKGFKTHFDTHDVFVLQIAGAKRWRIFEAPIVLPLKGQNYDSAEHESGTVTDELEVVPGNTIYIPRGVMHDACSSDEVSLHITVGMLSYTWVELLLEALAKLGLEDAAFRAALPVGFAQATFDRDAAKATFGRLLDTFRAQADFDDAFDHFVATFLATRAPLLRGQLEQVVGLDQLTLASALSPRRHLVYRQSVEGERVRLECYGRTIDLPHHAGDAVRFALATPGYAVGDLPGGLDDEAKLVLARRLLREGLIMRA